MLELVKTEPILKIMSHSRFIFWLTIETGGEDLPVFNGNQRHAQWCSFELQSPVMTIEANESDPIVEAKMLNGSSGAFVPV